MQRGDGVVGALLAPPAVDRHLAGRRRHALPHALDVAAGAEGRALAGDHHRADRVVAGDAVEQRDEVGAHGVVDGVAHLRAVEQQRGDAVADLDFDGGRLGGVGRHALVPPVGPGSVGLGCAETYAPPGRRR